MDPVPISGWKDWRYHIELKSPVVQPMRQREVLTPARRHADFKVQNESSVYPGLCLGLAFWQAERTWVCLGSKAVVLLLTKAMGSRADAPKYLKLELSFPCTRKPEGRGKQIIMIKLASICRSGRADRT